MASQKPYMPSIAFLGKDITEYKANSRKYLSGLHFYCPVHELELSYHSSYPRHVRDYKAEISIHRLGCPLKCCNHTQAILPDFLQPYKHYSANEIEAVLFDSKTSNCALDIDSKASISTLRRWITQYLPILDEKISHLKTNIYQKVRTVVNEMALANLGAMETIQSLLLQLPAIHYSNTLGGAFIYGNALDIPT